MRLRWSCELQSQDSTQPFPSRRRVVFLATIQSTPGERKVKQELSTGFEGEHPCYHMRDTSGSIVSRPLGPVAQWQSTGLITPGSLVRILPGPPVILRCMHCTMTPKWREATSGRRRRYLTESPSIAADVSASRALALQIADVIAEGPARDTVVLDIHGLTTISDFFVITSGENERQLRA